MTRCLLNDTDITEGIKDIYYGPNRNWGGYLWTYKEIFGENKKGHTFRFEFKDNNERIHWFHGYIDNEDYICNIPLATPVNQNSTI